MRLPTHAGGDHRSSPTVLPEPSKRAEGTGVRRRLPNCSNLPLRANARSERMTPFRFDGRVPAMVAAAALFAGCGGTQPSIAPITPIDVARPAAIVVTGANAEHVLYSFSGQYDGGNAATGLVHDRHGNWYGTTVVG